MLLEIEVENLQNTLTEVSKMRQYSVSLFGKRFFNLVKQSEAKLKKMVIKKKNISK